MIAMRDIVAGSELVNNYGELSNAELLRGYGFVERANRYNHVQVCMCLRVRVCMCVCVLMLLWCDFAFATKSYASLGGPKWAAVG